MNPNQNGFSVIQVLVSVGIAMISALAVTSVLDNSMKAQKSMTLNDDLSYQVSLIQMSLSTKNICGINLPYFKNKANGTLSFDSNNLSNVEFSVEKIQNSPSNIILINGGALPGQNNTKVNILMNHFVEIIPNSIYLAELHFDLDKSSNIKGTTLGARFITRKVPISLKTTAIGSTQSIVECYVKESTFSQEDLKNIKRDMCLSLSGTFDENTSLCDIGPYYQ